MTSDMPLPRLIEDRAARPALLSRTMNFRLMPRRISARNCVQLENRLGGGLEAGRWAFRRGQRRRVHPVGREKQCGAQAIRLPDEGAIFMTEVTP